MLHDSKAKFECDDCGTTTEVDPVRVDGLLGLPSGWVEVSVRSTGPSPRTVAVYQVLNLLRTQGASMGLDPADVDEQLGFLTPPAVHDATEKVQHYCTDCIGDFDVKPLRNDVRECSDQSAAKWAALTESVSLEALEAFVGGGADEEEADEA